MTRWLRLHVQSFAAAARRMLAQPLSALLSALVLALAIALPVIASIALGSAGAAVSRLDTEPHVNVYLALDAGDQDVKRVHEALRGHRDVQAVRFVSKAQAFEELKSTTHLADVLATLDRNPLPHAFTVRVRSDAQERVEALRAQLGALPKVEHVAADFEWSQRLRRWVGFGERLLGAAGLVLAAAVVFIVGHLIRLQVLTQRHEIEVSQLIGATAADVRRPFIYHGALQGLLAGVLAAALAIGLMLWAERELSALTHGYGAELKVIFPSASQWLSLVGASALLGIAGAWLAVSRELRRFSYA